MLAQIERLVVSVGQLALWSLGQAGFVVKGSDTIVYIDPYLSDSLAMSRGFARRFPIPLDPRAVQHASVVFATHEHLDHADAATLGPLLAASPQATLVTSPQGRNIALQVGVASERIIMPRLGEETTLGTLTYSAIPAAHDAHEVDSEGRSRWMGFLIICNGVTVYHAGDTILLPELFARLEGRRIDLALLPINGRDYFRDQQDIVGNLWPSEAVELAVAIQARVLIGMHNDLFDSNRVNPGMLLDELDRRAPWQRCHLLQPGGLYLYAGLRLWR